MRAVACCALLVCTPAAAQTPADRAQVTQTMQAIYANEPFIGAAGGTVEGLALGHTVSFVVTPDDRLLCNVEVGDPTTGGAESAVAYDLQVTGLFAALSALMASDVDFETGASPEFIAYVRRSAGADRQRKYIDSGSQGYADFAALLRVNETPCWEPQ